MSFITLISSHELDLSRPSPSMLTPAAIAHSLAQINRFNGHCRRPYSVAEHSLLVCDIAEREFELPLAGQLAALLHDAHEAITGDQPTPCKQEIGRAWAYWENKWQTLVWQEFDLKRAMLEHGVAVHRADRIALATERRDLVNNGPSPWISLHGVEPVSWVNLDTLDRTAALWCDWRDRWLTRYDKLVARMEAVEA